MLNKTKIKLIKSLHEKKYRNEYHLFLVEGEKSVLELLSSDFKIDYILSSKDFYSENSKLINSKGVEYDIVSTNEIEKVTSLQTNDSVIAVVHQKENKVFDINPNEIILILDDIRDPGNLGTVIRIADWYGIKKIIASENTVDLYNSKTISATKGSFTRVQMFYTNLEKYLESVKVPILGTFMNGENVHKFNFPKEGLLVMGNESNGISEKIESYITKKITIPSFGKAESLNVGIATAIVVDNWKRKSN